MIAWTADSVLAVNPRVPWSTVGWVLVFPVGVARLHPVPRRGRRVVPVLLPRRGAGRRPGRRGRVLRARARDLRRAHGLARRGQPGAVAKGSRSASTAVRKSGSSSASSRVACVAAMTPTSTGVAAPGGDPRRRSRTRRSASRRHRRRVGTDAAGAPSAAASARQNASSKRSQTTSTTPMPSCAIARWCGAAGRARTAPGRSSARRAARSRWRDRR